MNRIEAVIGEVRFAKGIVLVELFSDSDKFCSMVIGDKDDFAFAIGDRVDMLFKETELELAEDKGMALFGTNKFKATITSVDIGEVLGIVNMAYKETELSALIPSRWISQKKVEVGKHIIGLIRTHEIVLSAIT